VLYLVEDPNNPPPEPLRRSAHAEVDFNAAYFNRTGLLWRHYFGPSGPRPPPSMFMWPASEIGQTHTVTLRDGYWYESKYY
jgi:hypothetical protein